MDFRNITILLEIVQLAKSIAYAFKFLHAVKHVVMICNLILFKYLYWWMTGTLLTFVCCRLFFGFTINNLYLHLVYFLLLFIIQVGCSTMWYCEHYVQDDFVTLTKCGGRVFHSMMVRARRKIHIEVHIIIQSSSHAVVHNVNNVCSVNY